MLDNYLSAHLFLARHTSVSRDKWSRADALAQESGEAPATRVNRNPNLANAGLPPRPVCSASGRERAIAPRPQFPADRSLGYPFARLWIPQVVGSASRARVKGGDG